MLKNIRHNNIRGLGLKLRHDKYYDFMLYKGECEIVDADSCLIADITADGVSDGKVVSNVAWDGAVNGGVELNNIGFTGVDNGLIQFRRDRVTNREFLEIYSNSQLIIPEGDKRFYMTPISGNSNQYKYFYSVEEGEAGKYFSFKGGFLQGFYKLEDYDYSVLPNNIDHDWNFQFVLRRRDYDVHYRTLNHVHPENKGMFFYLGTRAENKFWWLYKRHENINALFDKENNHDGYFTDFDPEEINIATGDYFSRKVGDPTDLDVDEGYNLHCSGLDFIDGFYSADMYFYDPLKEGSVIDDYFADDYTGVGKTTCDGGYAVGSDYYEAELSLEGITVLTDNGHETGKRGYYEIKTDNKFLTFDRTKDGFTTKTFDPENPYVIFEGRKDWDNFNYFVLMNRTETGYTTDTIGEYNEENRRTFDIYKDIRNNAFGMRIADDGSIGYRYGITNCEEGNRYELVEEMSNPGVVPMDEWTTINLRVSIVSPQEINCTTRYGKRRMKLYVYVNGNLVLVSRELPEFNFRGLDDDKEKQESVPYNMSLGGGTQGLADGVWLNYYYKPPYRLPIERDFCGTFLGDVKSFKFYNSFIDYKTMKDMVFGV